MSRPPNPPLIKVNETEDTIIYAEPQACCAKLAKLKLGRKRYQILLGILCAVNAGLIVYVVR